MAGGKETPRQKMIGMMYLVLTAMLALNVSKSILEAFVAIEENIQKANINQTQRGNKAIADVNEELKTSTGDDNKVKRDKLQYVLKQMQEIDAETAKIIGDIDKLKIEMLEATGEDAKTYKDKDAEVILWEKADRVKPIRMNLMAVQAKDKYDDPMRIMGINEDLKNPKGKGLEIWNKFNAYRAKLVELTGSYKWPEQQKAYSIKVDAINNYSSYDDLTKKVEDMIVKNGTNANLKDDKDALVNIYKELTKLEKNIVGKDKNELHWIGMTFDHSPLVAAIASLSSLQQNVLSARAMALETWKSRVSTGEYSFNKITALAYGQPIANTGDSVYLKVMMAAYDSDNQPKVVVKEGAEGAKVDYPGNGQGIVGFKVGSGTEQIIKGSVSIKNKSGMDKTEDWEYKVTIMKPSGAISLPELNVLYKGYANQVEAVASGFDQTTLTGSVPISKTANGWIATPAPGPGRDATLTVSGKNSVTGKSQQLLTKPFKLRNMPKPDLQWGTAVNGGKGTKQETRIAAKYGDEVPLTANFTIKSWAVTVSGLMGEPTGSGGQLSAEAMSLIRQARPGSSVTIFAEVIGPDKTPKRITSVFKI